ncbi:NADPH:quinone reductase-like Zn-dependent oxidoreductase [Thermosporothrix hazakensis]|jgi:NADPH:quinone reductase-like Zn-dependent oxidoreductase|uniref:NADPH:quinone reductase-like Zn-dependent oxidoreductase n=1 Tax=Thermosporothrix hazakensis TaxID=644383 RepID=A0A326UKY6_THEHA|nr:zinc-binding dehydrogenase [Thermosporothrix hazakensis]PZW33033.1 NADPH:quinone reductase-like Zn-dependent oxidoreductase [Thermosporothrix hazakensis]GCE49065.1 NAD(P)H quinone oxidoreductase [Thermosporothrix hazakensis]
MKAALFTQYGDPDVLHLVEVPDPVPGPDDVLVEVKASTVNRLDLFQRAGSRPVPQLPFTPGLEAAGIVLQDANGFRAGERVLTTRASQAKGGGGYASKLAVPATDLVRIPEGVSFEQAAAAGLAASTAWGALFDLGKLQQGERVLIWAGSSGVGTIAIQLAKNAGAWVATTSSSAERAEKIQQLGADLVINYHEQDVAATLQKAGGVHLVIELVGATLQTSLDACALDGRVVLIGNLGGQQCTVDTQSWRLKRVTVIGGSQVHTAPANEEHVLQLIARKAINPCIARTFPIEQAAEAHRVLASGKIQGKLVLLHS